MFILETTPHHIPLNYTCLTKISNRIGHVSLICNRFCNLLYQWCALISAHPASSEQPTFPRRSTHMFSDFWMSTTSKLLTPPLRYLISSKLKMGCMRVNEFTIYQWHEDRWITWGIRCLRPLVDDETLSFSQCLTLTLCDGMILEGLLRSPQPYPKSIQISVWEDYFGQNFSVSKPNRLHVLIFRFVLYWVEVYSIDSSKMMGHCY